MFLETNRIILRYMSALDFDDLKLMLEDKDVMYAWEYTFNDTEVYNWINKNIELYRKYNLGYFIMEDKISHEVIGQAALMPDNINSKQYYEISYMLKKQYWHNGYAKECAEALINYAFNKLNLSEVIFEIRPENKPSIKVAEGLGAKISGEFVKQVREKEMLHLIYKISNK